MNAKSFCACAVLLMCASVCLGQSSNTFPASGNVGIGTTSPADSLDIEQGALAVTSGSSTGSGGYSSIYVSTIGTSTNSGYSSIQAFYAGIGWTTPLALQASGGNVGIGTTSPGAKLEVSGNIRLTSGSGASMTYADGTQQTTAWTGVLCGGDYAEDMRASGGKDKYGPGDVLVLSSEDSEDVQKSSEPYSTMVAGIFATKPGVIGRREEVATSASNIPMAMVGVVPTKVSAENGPIHKGDLLVSSATPGYAMKGTDHSRMLGAVIGKAMGSLDSGVGVIEVLVTLQ